MTEQQKNNARTIVSNGIVKVIRSYTENALLINACFVSIDKYAAVIGKMQLSTTQNIPEQLRLDNEFDVVYQADELIEKYLNDVQQVIFKNYIISTVSVVDAILEDLFEYLLKIITPAISDQDLEKQIRNAWTNDAMLNFLIDPAGIGLKKPAELGTEFAEAFMRYGELRIVRHTILHTDGVLSDKNYNKLQNNLLITPNERKHFALVGSPIFNDRNIVLSINHILSIRQYLHRFLSYIHQSITERAITL